MRKKLNNIILVLLPFSIITPGIFLNFIITEPQDNVLIITPNLDETKIIEVPPNKIFESYKVIEEEKIKLERSEVPSQGFSITKADAINYTFSEVVYEYPYSFEVLKKGDGETLRIFVPSIYYKDGYKIENKNITFKINYKSTAPTFQPASFEPQTGPKYVIITNESFWDIFYHNYREWVNENLNLLVPWVSVINVSDIVGVYTYSVHGPYGDATNESSGNPWIPDGKEVTSNYDMFNDTQAQIRNYIRRCYEAFNTRYILLAGNNDVVPARMVTSYAAGICPGCSGFYNDTSHASDMYYSCLHYCMNNNTNSYWMENAVCGSPVDEIDWGHDVHVGRVLINQPYEAFWWINKTKNYFANNQSNYTKWCAVPCKNGGGAISNQTWTGWAVEYQGPGIGDEFPGNISFINNQNITQAQWNILDDYANGNAGGLPGITLIYHAGHGGTLWTPYSDANLNNNHVPNFLITEGCHSANFGEDLSSRMEDWMSDKGGVFGGVSNSAYGWFVASTFYGEQMMREMFNDSNTTNFCIALENAKEKVGHDPDCVWGQIVKGANFFGDPALTWSWYNVTDINIQFIDIDNGGNGTYVRDSNPTFNWTHFDNVDSYQLQISTVQDFSSLVVNLSNISYISYPDYCTFSENVTFTLPPEYSLPEQIVYYCRVRGYYKP